MSKKNWASHFPITLFCVNCGKKSGEPPPPPPPPEGMMLGFDDQRMQFLSKTINDSSFGTVAPSITLMLIRWLLPVRRWIRPR